VAYAELALSEYYAADSGGAVAVKQEALPTADKAVILAPDEADAHAVRGFLRAYISWDWSGAQADFAKALALDPDDSAINRRYARLLASNGRLSEAIAATKKAIGLDPLSSTAWSNLGLQLIENGQFAAAQEAIRRSLEIQPESAYALSNLGAVQLLEGNPAEALATFRQVTREAFCLTGIAMAEHALSHVKESQQALDELIAKHAQDSACEIAKVYAWRGEKDKAFEWLERAYQQHDGALSEVKVNVLLASLRGDSRFAALLRKMQLPE
jgi:tetratricopeptide (TPR) repeat protein